MFKLSDEDEDSFFTPVTKLVPQPICSSNLAALFGTKVVAVDTNSSLTYSAPKEPNKNKPSAQNVDVKDSRASPTQKPQSTVLIMKVVHAFKLVENKYIPLGKLGFALVGVSEHYQLILYQGKNDYKMTTKVRSTFQLSILDNNYVSFYDDLKQNWSLMFSDEKDLKEFSREVEICGGTLIHAKQSADVSKPSLPEKPERLQHEPERSTRVELPTPDSDSSDRSNTKKSILSRMAKMGQSVLLPTFTSPHNNRSDITDSDTEEERRAVRKQTKRVPETNAHAQLRRFDRTIEPVVATNSVASPAVDPYEAYQRAMQMVPVVTSNAMSPEALNVYFAENRTHNSEVRMCMMKLDSKIDKVLERLDKNDEKRANRPRESDDGDGRKLDELETTLEEYKQRITSFENNEKKLMNEYESKVSDLEQKLKKSSDRVEDLSNKVELYETRIDEMQDELKSLRDRQQVEEQAREDFEAERSECERRIRDSNDKLEAVEKKSAELESRNADLVSEIEAYRSKSEQVDGQSGSDAANKNLEVDIKQAMNDLFVQLAAGDKDLRTVIVNSTYKLIAKVTSTAETQTNVPDNDKKTTD